MTENEKKDPSDPLIKALDSLTGNYPKPDLDHPDYTGWDQTEEEYQKQQKAWLEKVKKKKTPAG